MHVVSPRTLLALAAAVAFATSVSPAAAQSSPTFTTLHSFTGSPDGREPAGGVTPLGRALYGTTNVGGDSDSGAIYRIDPDGTETVLYSFRGGFGSPVDGGAPEGELAAGPGGLLYGTTAFGGAFNGGTVFRFDPATRTETILHDFGSGDDGALPAAGVILVGGRLYGTTTGGGASGSGTVFSLDLATGVETVLHAFAGGDDGSTPFAPVTSSGGLLYGTTFFGGPSNVGTVFRVDPVTGAETVLHAFTGASFTANPAAGLVAHGGRLYGTTAHGGLPGCGGSNCGAVFEVDAATGAERDLYRFTSQVDGEDPEGGLVWRDGFLFGTTMEGGRSGLGTVFAVQVSTGAKRTLHDFERQAPGINPGTLTAVGRTLYGTTHGGGLAGQGTVFSLAR